MKFMKIQVCFWFFRVWDALFTWRANRFWIVAPRIFLNLKIVETTFKRKTKRFSIIRTICAFVLNNILGYKWHQHAFEHSHSNLKSTTFSITSLDFSVNTTITDLIKWTPLGSITLITAHNSCSVREHSLCVTPSTEGEIADYLGDVFSEEVRRIFLINKGYPDLYKYKPLEECIR